MFVLEYNHFEIVLLEEFSDIKPPPGMFYQCILFINFF